jgi:hypothetical protein
MIDVVDLDDQMNAVGGSPEGQRPGLARVVDDLKREAA